MNKVPITELSSRMDRFRKKMDQESPDWLLAVFVSKINLYYFTGTMQDAMLLIPRENEAVLWVRRSIERALDESLFPDIRPMGSYRDAVSSMGTHRFPVHMETEIIPMALYQRMQKYFEFSSCLPLDNQIAAVRSVKSSYELGLMRDSGRIHSKVLEEKVPLLLREGINEAQFTIDLYGVLIDEGYHGVTRFSMFDTEAILGQIGFGESSVYPTYFNGPGGHLGMSPAVPILANRNRLLKQGDLVFVDIGCGVDGYHTDKTMTYMFKSPLPDEVLRIHERCVAIQDEIAAMLKPGAIPSEIYRTIISSLEPDFLKNFMGYGNRRVKFLGHSIGLVIDETPVIAQGFDKPIEEGMVFALEPKKGIEGIGTVGIENTFIITKNGSECITGQCRGMIPVY